MRVSEEIVRSGVFWIPGQENKLSGVLKIQDGGRIELELVGLFSNELREAFETPPISRIVGQVEKEGLVTLDNCFYLNRNVSFGGISKSRVFVNTLYFGVLFDLDEQILMSSLRFSVEGLDEWLRISGISVQHYVEERRATISYASPDEISYDLGSGIKLIFTHTWTLPGSEIITSAEIKHRNFIRLEAENPVSIEVLQQIAHRINTFLCLAIDQNVSLMDATVSSTAIVDSPTTGEPRPVRIAIYYQAQNFSEKLPKVEYFNMIFRFPSVRERFELMIRAWLLAYEQISPALNLYFSTRNNAQRYLDGKFLALAQGLESYHRRTTTATLLSESDFDQLMRALVDACPEERREWLSQRLQHANELSFAKRLASLVSKFDPVFGDQDATKRFIRGIVDTRNYLTHYDESLSSRAVVGAELWPLVRRMEALFQMLLLTSMKFEAAEVVNIVNSSGRFQDRLRAQ